MLVDRGENPHKGCDSQGGKTGAKVRISISFHSFLLLIPRILILSFSFSAFLDVYDVTDGALRYPVSSCGRLIDDFSLKYHGRGAAAVQVIGRFTSKLLQKLRKLVETEPRALLRPPVGDDENVMIFSQNPDRGSRIAGHCHSDLLVLRNLNLRIFEKGRPEGKDLFGPGAEKELAPYRESSTAAVLAGAQARHEAAVEHHDSADAALQKAREVATDAALDSAVAAAEEKLTRQRGVLAELSAVDVDTVFALYEGVKEEVRSLHNTVHDADGDMREYSGRIEMHSGVAERLESANAELEIAREVLAAVEKRANAARYLRELLLTHRDAARQRYAQPFVTKLNGLARKVFGGDVDFELSEELVVTARSRDGQTVDLGSLSGGAKEQMAILTRFAIAGLVQDDGVPVIVDDALGSTDSTRLNLMATLFAQVAKHSQVLVLTCMPQRYARVPSRVELDIEALKG